MFVKSVEFMNFLSITTFRYFHIFDIVDSTGNRRIHELDIRRSRPSANRVNSQRCEGAESTRGPVPEFSIYRKNLPDSIEGH